MRFKIPSALPQLLQRLQAIRQSIHRRRQQSSELAHMSARELNDLGIGRGDIPALLNQPTAWLVDRT